MRLLTVAVASLTLTACANYMLEDIPVVAEVYEEKLTLVAKTTQLKDQVLVENQIVTKTQVDGNLYYCTDVVSFEEGFHNCFAYKDMTLTHGMNPLTQALEPLIALVPIKQIDRGRKP